MTVVAMVRVTVKLFQNVLTYFEAMGIYSLQSDQAQSYNGKKLLIPLSLAIMFTSTSAFLVFKAAAVFEYAICFYFGITRPTAVAIFLILSFQMPNIIKFIENCEQFVNRSEWKFQFGIQKQFIQTCFSFWK